jgi:hypothetical protein
MATRESFSLGQLVSEIMATNIRMKNIRSTANPASAY